MANKSVTPRVATLLRQEGRNLAAMMGLMVEDVGDRPPEWRLEVLTAASVLEGGGELFGAKPG